MQTAGQVENRIKELTKHGQSIWLDFIARKFVRDGELKRLVEEDGVRGVTSNPSIFEKAIAGGDEYAEQMDELFENLKLDANDVYEELAIADIKDACDALRTVYEETVGRDGYVSMEVSPLLAADTEATVSEARRLWKAVDRPNLMIKVPGTEEGIPAVATLIGEGINVNVTLLFGQKTYARVAEAYMAGLETYARDHDDLGKIASVASFFVSRIDSAVDKLLQEIIDKSETEKDRRSAGHLLGKIAVANAKLAYQIYRDLFTSERWKALVARGARPQRLLWASTSTKNPDYKDTLYVDELIGNETVNTLPLSTLDAFKDHGTAQDVLDKSLEEAKEQVETLGNLGISLDEVTDQLVVEGVDAFADAFRKLLAAVEARRVSTLPDLTPSMTFHLPEKFENELASLVEEWQSADRVKQLWSRDTSLWTGRDEDMWMDWLHVVDDQLGELGKFHALAEELKDGPFSDVLLLGMGGSSLCPEVMSLTFGRMPGFPRFQILDSTNPEQVKAREESIDLEHSLFVVASKSGSTLEPNIFMDYFFHRMKETVGEEKAGDHFVAITDPGSKLEEVARASRFRHIFHGYPAIGGRYSALSDFGMIPSAMMGVDVCRFLSSTREMVEACSAWSPVKKNPGVHLGLLLGLCAKAGRDKMTILTSESVSDLGAWLEQLVAESTGKDGRAIIPVDRELIGSPDSYGDDRIFVCLKLESDSVGALDDAIESLIEAGHPVVRINISDRLDLGQEFFRFEIATAVAGSILEINPFNQPDVEASKVASRALTKAYETAGAFPPEEPLFEDECCKLFADQENSAYLKETTGEDQSLGSYINAHLGRLGKGDYFALLAYLDMTEANERLLQNIRHAVRDARKTATCLGFGPRFLHSTGQAYKGGPDSGVFLQITSDHESDLDVPGHKYSFGVVVDAQARGDLEVLVERKRRVLRVHLGKDINQGLRKLQKALVR